MYDFPPKISSFRDLKAWQQAYSLTLSVYEITKTFPKEELFVIVTQLRRAAISITSNIAEGFSRNSDKEKMQFFYTALGSLTEVRNQLNLAKGIGYLSDQQYSCLENETIVIDKLIHGLIKKCRAFIHNT